jgi:hypothetical protein
MYIFQECDQLCPSPSGVQQKEGRIPHTRGRYPDLEFWPNVKAYFFHKI